MAQRLSQLQRKATGITTELRKRALLIIANRENLPFVIGHYLEPLEWLLDNGYLTRLAYYKFSLTVEGNKAVKFFKFYKVSRIS